MAGRSQTRGVAQGVIAQVQRAWGESPFYQAQLKGPAPDRLLCQPVDPRTPDRTLAEALFSGRLTVGAESIDCEGEIERAWDLAAAPGPLHSFLHDFSWLRHAGAIGDGAIAPVRQLTRAWLDRCEKWSPDAWTPYLTGERLAHLCAGSTLVLKGGDALWRSRVLSSMARQTRHLARAGHRSDTGYERLMTAAGLVLASLCLPGCGEELERGVELMRRELRLQIRPDGGHVSRNPSQQLAIVIRLQMILKAMEARRVSVPGFLKHVMARAAANVQFFRVGDGLLAVFNGGYEDDPRAILAANQSVEADAAPPSFARHSGFQRLEAGRTLLIADTSAPRATSRYDGSGSFLLASGRARIIVNCGNGGHLSGEWRKALRQAAAHSTLSVEPAGAGSIAGGPVVHRRAEDRRGHLLEIDRFLTADEVEGPRYSRRLFLTGIGDNLRGEDSLAAAPPALAAGWRLRFHLHPAVKASLARDGRSVILALPTREGWRFRTDAAELKLERSVYCGGGGLPVASSQIVLAPRSLEGEPLRDMIVKWAFQRLDGVWAGEPRPGDADPGERERET